MKPGTMVAFIANAELQFGILSALIRRETKDGETTQFVVTSHGADGTANADVTISDEEDIVEAMGWNADGKIYALARRLASYKSALKLSENANAGIAPPRESGEVVVYPSPENPL